MRTTQSRWTRMAWVILGVTVLCGGLIRPAVAAKQTIEVTTEPGKQIGSGLGAILPDTTQLNLILDGKYDPKKNPKGYTGSGIVLPEGAIWRKSVDEAGRDAYAIEFADGSAGVVIVVTGHCPPGGSGGGGPCPKFASASCTVSFTAPTQCQCGSNQFSQKTVTVNKEAEQAISVAPGGGILLPRLISGDTFPPEDLAKRSPYKLITVELNLPANVSKAAGGGTVNWSVSGAGLSIVGPSSTSISAVGDGGSVSASVGLQTNDNFTGNGSVTASVSVPVINNDGTTGPSASCSASANVGWCDCGSLNPQPPCDTCDALCRKTASGPMMSGKVSMGPDEQRLTTCTSCAASVLEGIRTFRSNLPSSDIQRLSGN